MKNGYVKPALALLLLLIFCGCGYHIAGKAGRFPGGVESLAMPVFVNMTVKPDIESELTSAFVSEFVTSVKVEGASPHAMYGVINRYDLTPVSFTKSDINQEYRLTVELALSIVEKSSGKVLWHEDRVTDFEDFAVDINNVTETTEREEAALRKLARDTARLVKERMFEGF